MTEKTNLEQAQLSMIYSRKQKQNSMQEQTSRDDAIAYALLSIAETLAEINKKLDAVEHVVYTPGEDG